MVPPGYPLPPPPPGPGPYRAQTHVYGPPSVTDTRAVASLILGILSISCGGLVLGIPAIVFGTIAKKDIDRSMGATSGGQLATAGIVTGIIGTVASIVFVVAMAIAVVSGSRAAAVPHRSTPGTAGRTTVGRVDVVQLSGADGSLEDQLASEQARARSARKVLVVQTTATWCTVCDEIDASLSDARMQSALTGVQLVRVDVDEFRSELEMHDMWEGSVPWFYKVDSMARPVDAISADEWDDNIPQNMAPVLKAFAAGTLTNRRHATQIGTPL